MCTEVQSCSFASIYNHSDLLNHQNLALRMNTRFNLLSSISRNISLWNTSLLRKTKKCHSSSSKYIQLSNYSLANRNWSVTLAIWQSSKPLNRDPWTQLFKVTISITLWSFLVTPQVVARLRYCQDKIMSTAIEHGQHYTHVRLLQILSSTAKRFYCGLQMKATPVT